MANTSNMIINNDVLEEYTGSDEYVVIPDGIKTIGTGAFGDVDSLIEVILPEGVEELGYAAFAGCGNLKKIVLPESIRTIGSYAFEDCVELTDISIPNSVESIGTCAFHRCKQLDNITVPNEIKELGSGAFCDCSSLSSFEIPKSQDTVASLLFKGCSSLKTIDIPKQISQIGAYAFSGCENLESITIANEMTKFGRGVFFGCYHLKDIKLPNNGIEVEDGILVSYFGPAETISVPANTTGIGKNAFRGCNNLTKITIPETVTHVDEGAFTECSNLTMITIPNTVKEIGADAFSACTSLTDIVLPEGLEEIKARTFMNCSSIKAVSIPNTVTSIGALAFSGCKSLSEVVIPEGVNKIEKHAFEGCSGLSKIDISNTVMKIEEYAFSGCSHLGEIRIPDKVTSIECETFLGCSCLTSIVIPDNVRSIGIRAFAYCDELTEIILPADFNLHSISHDAFVGCSKLKNEALPGGGFNTSGDVLYDYFGTEATIEIPSGITSLAKDTYGWGGAFSGHSGVTSIKIPDSVSEICARTFYECVNLKHVDLPDSLTEINDGMFSGCKNLVEISIPDKVTKIGDSAFYGCSSLSELVIPEGVTEIGENTFGNCENLNELTIPISLKKMGANVFGDKLPEGLIHHVKSIFPLLSDSMLKQYVLCESVWNALPVDVRADIFLSRQGKSLSAAYINVITADQVDDLANEIIERLTEKASAKTCNAVYSFVSTFYAKATRNILKKMYEALKNQKNGAKALTAIDSDPELHWISGTSTDENGTDSKADSKIARLIQKHGVSSSELGIRIKEYYGLNYQDIPELLDNEGNSVGKEVTALLLTMHEKLNQRYKWEKPEVIPEYEKPGISPEAEEIIAEIDQSSLKSAISLLADSYLQKYENTKKKYLALPICRFADESLMAELVKRAPSWQTSVSGIDAPPLKQFRRGVLYNNSRSAMLFAERYHELGEYAGLRGTDEETLRDTVLVDFGLDEAGKKYYDLGSDTLTAFVGADLTLSLISNTTGKTYKSIPKRGTDPDKYDAAKRDYDEMRRNIKKVVNSRNDRLFKAFLDGTTYNADDWVQTYIKNPVLRVVASLLVWEQDNNTFTLRNGVPFDVSGQEISLSQEKIRLTHPMEMTKEDVDAWQNYFITNGLKQPFAQIWEPVVDLSEVKEDRYVGCEIPYYRFLNKEKHGISVSDEDYHNYIEIYFNGCSADIQRLVPKRHDIQMNDTFEVSKICIDDKQKRRANHIIAYLDQVTVKERIMKDDESVINLMDRFTLAQIMEFIAVAQEKSSMNVLTLLMEYKNNHYGETDVVSGLLLE